MLDGHFETDHSLRVDHPEIGRGGGRRNASPISPEALLVELWERKQGVRVALREEEFLGRPEVRELVACSSFHLEEGAKFAIRRNAHHHLLLTEWVTEVRSIQAAEGRTRGRVRGSISTLEAHQDARTGSVHARF